MDDAPPVVVKVGGSLLDWPELGPRLREYLGTLRGRGSKIVLIVGGGEVVDAVRALDRLHRLGDDAAHRLALRGMDLTAHALAALLDGVPVREAPELSAADWGAGDVVILAPRTFLEEIDGRSASPLPASWDVTSDSIAARVAAHLGASRLILLKSADVRATTRGEAARLGLVDPYFPEAARPIELVECVAFRTPDWSPRVLIS